MVSSLARFKVGENGEIQESANTWKALLREHKLRSATLAEAAAILFKPYCNMASIAAYTTGSKKDIVSESQLGWFENKTELWRAKTAGVPKGKVDKILKKIRDKLEARKLEEKVEEHLRKHFDYLEVEKDEHD